MATPDPGPGGAEAALTRARAAFRPLLESRLLEVASTNSKPAAHATTAAADGEVTTGVVVSLRYAGDTDVEKYLIGSIEERQEGVSVVSPSSPLGQALMGRHQGDRITYAAPSGDLEVEIVEVGA